MYTDSRGRYSFGNLPLGYSGLAIEIGKPGWVSYGYLLGTLTSTSTNNDLFIRADGVPAGGRDFFVYDQTTGANIPATLQIRIPSGHTSRIALPNGYYDRLSGLPAWQTYDFTVTAPGYRSVTWLNQQVHYDTWWSISFSLPRSNQAVGRILGVVRNLITGNPIPNAQVSCFGAVTTDSQGRFTLENQPLGTYTLGVAAPGYTSRSVQITIHAGRVQARIQIRDRDTGQVVREETVALGDSGAFVVPNVPSGTYKVWVKPLGWCAEEADGITMPNLLPVAFSSGAQGDVNDDNVVDDADLLAVLFDFGNGGTNPYLAADLNKDGTVDDADLLIVLFNFGSSGTP